MTRPRPGVIEADPLRYGASGARPAPPQAYGSRLPEYTEDSHVAPLFLHRVPLCVGLKPVPKQM